MAFCPAGGDIVLQGGRQRAVISVLQKEMERLWLESGGFYLRAGVRPQDASCCNLVMVRGQLAFPGSSARSGSVPESVLEVRALWVLLATGRQTLIGVPYCKAR